MPEPGLATSDRAWPIDDRELEAFTAFALETVRAAGQLTLQHFRRSPRVDNKRDEGDYDPVTAADRDAEQLIRERIKSRYPRHGIFGEEHGAEPGEDGLTWVVDPIDGTRAFITGQLHWGVLMALFDGREPVLGAMYQPVTDELFFGSARGGFLEQRGERQQLASRACARLEDAVLCCTTPEMFADPTELDAFNRLGRSVRMLRYGGDCYSYCMLALGLVDLVVESSLEAYDIQALIPIVRAAGGGVSSWRGDSAAHGGAVVAFGDPSLRDPVLRCLAGG